MFWILLAILSAFGQSTKDTLAKYLTGKFLVTSLTFWITVFILPLFLLTYLLNESYLNLGQITWLFIALACFDGMTDSLSGLLLHKAFKISDISSVIPILNFSILFTLIADFLLLDKIPDLAIFLGIISIFVGSYILKFNHQLSFLEPIKLLFTDHGSLYILLTAAIWGFGNTITRIGVLEVDPYSWSLTNKLAALATLFAVIMLSRSRHFQFKLAKKNFFLFTIMGLLLGSSILIQSIISVKLDPSIINSLLRFGTLFSVILGIVFFKERSFIWQKFVGAIIMIVGVIVINWNL